MKSPISTDNKIIPLPFFFRHLGVEGKYLITNIGGAYAVLNSRDELEQVAGGDCAKIPKQKLDELIAKSFVATKGEYDARLSLIGSRYASLLSSAIIPPSLFLINPTLRCDHACRYCQASRVDESKYGYDIKYDDIPKIIANINKSPGDSKKIEFQGGEPLLMFDYIKQFVAQAELILGTKNVSYVICTSVGPMTDEMLDWAKRHDVVFSVSLDGPEAIHDYNRPLGSMSSHANTHKWIEKIKTELGEGRVSCLATITKMSLRYPKEIVREYFCRDLGGVFLRPLSPFGFAATGWRSIGYTADEFFDFYSRALDEVILLNKYRIFVDELTMVHLSKIFQAGCSGYADLKTPAGYLMGGMVFNYDGNVFGSDESRMLWESTKAPELVLGNVDNDFAELVGNERNVTLLSDTIISTTPGCDECVYQPYCGSDPLFHLATQGDHVGDKSISFFCKLERLVFDHLFSLYETSPDAREVFDRWLCRSE